MGGPAVINGKLYPEFDNFYECKIDYEEMTWCSAEQLYQAMKFKDKTYRKAINKQKSRSMYYSMGQVRHKKLIDKFEQRRAENMYIANLEKFKQNPDLLKLLLSTKGKITCRGSTEFWNNKNAEILEKIRELYRN